MSPGRVFFLTAAAALLLLPSLVFAGGQNFTAHLSGDQEVPARETLATGQAIFHLSGDETALDYQLIVATSTSAPRA